MELKLSPRANSTRGFSLTEVAIVLGIVGVVLASIWAYAATMNDKVKQERFSSMLTAIIGEVRGNYVGKTYFDSTDVTAMMPDLAEKGVFPADAVKLNGAVSVVVSPFGEFTNPNSTGSVYKSLYVCGWKAVGSNACEFSAGTSDVPLFAIEALLPRGNACIAGALRNSSAVSLPGLVAVYINGNRQTLPLTLAAAEDNVKGCINPVNVVDYVFRLVP